MSKNYADEYRKLLEDVANGEGDIYGYSNLEHKIFSEFTTEIREYRNAVARKKRMDHFIVPNTPNNLDLYHSHFDEADWKLYLRGRFIPNELLNVDCDMYVWDGKVGICTFDNEKLHVEILTNPTVVNLYLQFLKLLWGIGLEESVFFGPRTSKLTGVEKSFYLTEQKGLLDLTDASPQQLNPKWIEDIRLNVTGERFFDKSTVEMLNIIEGFFTEFFKFKNVAVIASSATIAFAIACDVLVETPGDEVIIEEPGFDVHPNVIRSYGANVVHVKRKSDFRLDIEEIISKITQRTRAIVICVPENPVGIVHTQEEIVQIADICKEHKIILILDYCFARISPFKKEMPILPEFYDTQKLSYLCIADTGKVLGLDGSKFGALFYSNDLEQKVNNKMNNYFYQLNKYDLHTVSSIIRDERFKEYVTMLNDQIAKNYECLKTNIHSLVSVQVLEGGSVCMLDISKTGMKDVDFVTVLKEKTGVGLVPVSYFYSGLVTPVDYSYVRMALARPNEVIADGVEKINSFVSALSL